MGVYPIIKKLITLTLFVLFIFTGMSLASASDLNTTPPSSTVKLVFIHHSCGGNWLADGNGNLGDELNDNNYYVTETNYGWDAEPGDDIGSSTDTSDWPSWFNDDKMPYVYSNNAHYAYSNKITDPGGENDIIMFKSCYPCSEVGSSVDDEKSYYNTIKDYFEAHPEKLFVLITPPGEAEVTSYLKTRELCNWLVDSENGWLKDYSGNNILVFDFYGVLSETNSHHRVVGDTIEHVYASNYDGISPYHNGDDHPNSEGNQKATNEFIPLLNYAYNLWKGVEKLDVTSTDPDNSETNVDPDKVITVTFNEAITYGNRYIRLTDSNGTSIPINTSINGNILTIDPISTLSDGLYTIRLHTGCVTNLSGDPLEPYSSTFTVNIVGLSITSTSPVNGTTRVSPSKTITVTFSEAIIKSSSFWVQLVNSSGIEIPYTSYITGGNMLVISPVDDLTESSYKVMLHTGCVTDLAGTPLAGQSFRFSIGSEPTITATSPVDGETNVSTAKTITVTFNETIRKSRNFWVELVDAADTAVDYTSYITGGNMLVINPTDDLSANSTYRLKLHTGCVTDLAGNPVSSKVIVFFTRSV